MPQEYSSILLIMYPLLMLFGLIISKLFDNMGFYDLYDSLMTFLMLIYFTIIFILPVVCSLIKAFKKSYFIMSLLIAYSIVIINGIFLAVSILLII